MPPIAAVGSLNPVKKRAVCHALDKKSISAVVLECQVFGGIGAQPMTADETLRGSCTRARVARLELDADYGFGLEGGLMQLGEQWFCIGFATVDTRDGRVRSAMSPGVWVPPPVMGMVFDGMELGDAEDLYFGRKNTKQAGGLIGVVTGGLVEREETFALPLLTALCSLDF